jgi:ankyrin repeat protein
LISYSSHNTLSFTVKSQMQDGDTLLHLASSNGQLDVVRYLIEKCGADVNVKGDVREFD